MRGTFWMVCCVSPQAGSEHSSVCKWKHSTPEWSKELPAGDRSAWSDECRLRINVTKLSYLSSFSFYLRHTFFMHGASLKLRYLRIVSFCIWLLRFRGQPPQPSTVWGPQPPSVGDGWRIPGGGQKVSPLLPFLCTSPPIQALAPHVRAFHWVIADIFLVNFSLKKSHQMFQQVMNIKISSEGVLKCVLNVFRWMQLQM